MVNFRLETKQKYRCIPFKLTWDLTGGLFETLGQLLHLKPYKLMISKVKKLKNFISV